MLKISRPKPFAAALLACAALVAVAGGQSLAQKPGAGGPPPPPAVFVTPAVMGDFADMIEGLGTARANETITVTAETTDKVVQIHFEEGQEVKAGDLLVTLDKAQEDADLRAALSLLPEREAALKRAQSLASSNALSRSALEEREAAVRQTKAQADSARARLAPLEIRAPFAGITGLRQTSVGALVKPGDVITSLDDLSRIKIDFDLPSIYLSQLKAGLEIRARSDAFPDTVFAGMIETVNAQINPVTRTVSVRAVADNPEGLLKPGLLMQIEIPTQSRKALLIPEQALVKRGDKNFVFVPEAGEQGAVAREREVKIGKRVPGKIEILDGLKEGEKVIYHGLLKVGDNAPITVTAEGEGQTPLTELLEKAGSQSQKEKGGGK